MHAHTHDMDDDDIPEKLLAVKTYIRIGADGQAQVVRMEPMITQDNTFVPHLVRIYIDEQEAPTVFERGAAYEMLDHTRCVPIEQAMSFKHLMRN